jgi:hypothetical protein
MFDKKIACPVCKHTFVHLGKVEEKNGNDNYESGWGGRGDSVEVGMWCEQGHNWKMILGFHKGNTYVFNRVMETKTTDMEIRLEQE